MKWQKLVQEHGEEYARANPPEHCTAEQWTKMIDSQWKTQTFKVKKINKHYLLIQTT